MSKPKAVSRRACGFPELRVICAAAGGSCATVPHATILGGGAVYNYNVGTATFTGCRYEPRVSSPQYKSGLHATVQYDRSEPHGRQQELNNVTSHVNES